MNKKWTKPAQRLFALFLCVAMVLPMLPQVVRAVDSNLATLVEDGILASGSLNAVGVATTNKQLQLIEVTSGKLQHAGHYVITDYDRNFIMAHDASLVPEKTDQSETGSLLRDDDAESLDTFYIDKSGKLIIDHSDRDSAMWVLKHYPQGNGGVTPTFHQDIKPHTLASNDTYKWCGVLGTDVFGCSEVFDAIELAKGIWSAKDEGNELNGPYWYNSDKDNLYLNWGSLKEDLFRDATQPNDGSRHRSSLGRFVEADGSVSYILYFYTETKDDADVRNPDLTFMFCDAEGTWSRQRYYTDSKGETPTGAKPYKDIITDGGLNAQGTVKADELQKYKIRLYKYEETNATKSLTATGYLNYYVANGVDKATIAGAIAENTKVYDSNTKQYVACTGTSARTGAYYINTNDWTLRYVQDNYDNGTNKATEMVIATLNVKQGAVSAVSGTTVSGEAITSKNSYTDAVLYRTKVNAAGNRVSTDDVVSFTIKIGAEEVQAKATVGMLKLGTTNDQFNTSVADQKTGTNVNLMFMGVDVGDLKVFVADGTIAQQIPGYPEAGSVHVFKDGTTGDFEFSTNGVANIMLSATGKPVDKGVDLVIMVDLSSSMRFGLNNNSEQCPVYWASNNTSNVGTAATNWNEDKWKNTRMYAMEESLKTLVKTLRLNGSDVRIAVSDFGDIDVYDFVGATLLPEGHAMREYPHLEMGDGNGSAWSKDAKSFYEFTNILSFVMGTNDSDNGILSRPFHIHNYKWYYGEDTMHGTKLPQVYTGTKTMTSGAFQDVNGLDDGAMSEMIKQLRISNSKLLGTNYDVGLEYAYKLAYQRRQANLANGEDREIVCIFMSDGAAMQYNYLSGYAGSNAWVQTVLGNADDILTTHDQAYSWSLKPDDDNRYHLADWDKMHPLLQDLFQELHYTLREGKLMDPRGTGTIPKCGCSDANCTGARFISCVTNPGAGVYRLPAYGKIEDGKDVSINWLDIFKMQFLDGSSVVGSTNHIQMTINGAQVTGRDLRNALFTELVKANTGDYQTYSPFYYFYNENGQNWWAEAIKGSADKIYPVINKYANGGVSATGKKNPISYNGEPGYENNFSGETTKNLALDGQQYISGFAGLGLKLYTIGFALAQDQKYSKDDQVQVLKNIATTEKYFYLASSTHELTQSLLDITDDVKTSATMAYFTDTMGEDYDLLTDKTVTDRDGTQFDVKVSPSISVKEYLVNNNGEPVREIRTLEVIQFTGGNKFTSIVYNSDGSVKSTKEKTVDGNGLIQGDRVIYNTNKDKSVDLYLDNSGRKFTLAPETFFWSVGNIPETALVLEYQVYLTGSMSGKYDFYPDRTNHKTNESADLYYVDYMGNNITKETVSPVYPWDPLEGVVVVVDYGLPVTISALENSKFHTVFNSYLTDGIAPVSFEGAQICAAKKGKISHDDYNKNGTSQALDSSYTTDLSIAIPGDFGSLTVNSGDGTLTYTPDSTDDKLEMDHSDIFTYVVKNPQDGKLYYCYAVIVPATTIYYEDNHVSYNTFTKNGASWSEKADAVCGWNEGAEPSGEQDMDLIGAGNIYGYDSHYTAMNQHSMGSASSVTVTADKYATVNFTFTGTGFDIISRTGSDTGIIMIDVFQAGTDKRPEGYTPLNATEFVDTYYGYSLEHCEFEHFYNENGEWVVSCVRRSKTQITDTKTPNVAPSNPKAGESKYYTYGWAWFAENVDDVLYQIPVVKHSGLPYGTYDVTITVAYNEWLDHPAPGDGKYDFYLDAIRIYDPAGVNGSADDTGFSAYAYEKDGEAKPEFIELRNEIISKSDFESVQNITGIAYVDNSNKENSPKPTVSDYYNYGSKNEIYLLADQSIVFTLDNPEKLNEVHLAMKSVNSAATVKIQYLDGTTLKVFKLDGKEATTIATATDLYYDISDLAGKTVVITNTSGGILSITNIKTTYTDTPTAEETAQLLTVRNLETVLAAMVASEEEKEPEQNEPEQNEPEQNEPEQNEPEQNQPEQNQPGKEETPGTGDIGLEAMILVFVTACVMMLAVLVVTHSRKNTAK